MMGVCQGDRKTQATNPVSLFLLWAEQQRSLNVHQDRPEPLTPLGGVLGALLQLATGLLQRLPAGLLTHQSTGIQKLPLQPVSIPLFLVEDLAHPRHRVHVSSPDACRRNKKKAFKSPRR